MSATTSTTATRKRLPRESQRASRPVGWARAAVLGSIGLDVTILLAGVALLPSELLSEWLDLVVWTLSAAVVGFAAIQTPAGPQLGMDMPVLLAAGYVLGPIPAGIVAFAGYVDMREFRGEISLGRALFNRAQTSLSVMAAAGVFWLLGGSNSSTLWPEAAIAALVAVGVDCLFNFGMVGGVMALHERIPPRAAIARLRLGPMVAFVGTYACFGLLSLLLAEVSVAVGPWGLLLFALPLVLARQAFSSGQRLMGAEQRLRLQGIALKEASNRVADERRDERLTIASGLHDDVLPPLFRVHLLGQVLRQELASGQLLAMEDDLPALLRATDEARETLRGLIQSLRVSPLGTDGLPRTLQLLVRQLELESNCVFDADIDDVRATPVVELLAYQVAREALRNAVRHSGAGCIKLVLSRDQDCIRIVVEDDGRGFAVGLVDEQKHLGIALMRERVDLAGGLLQVDSSREKGTRVIARLPLVDRIQT